MELFPICDENLNLSPNIWYSICGIGESPSMRVGHCLVHHRAASPYQNSSDKGRLFFVGGANPSNCFNEIYVLNLNDFSWDKHVDLEQLDNGRYEHASFVFKDQIFIFGGANQGENFNDVILFDIIAKKTHKVELLSTNVPLPRTFHSVCTYKDQLIVFGGGKIAKKAVEDEKVHIFNPKNRKWISLNIQKGPGVRHGHVMVNYEDETIFLHGGMNEEVIYEDIWCLNFKSLAWTQINLKKNHSYPCARAAHCGICINKNIYIFGGIDKNGIALDDLWKFNIDSNEWTQIEIFGYKPPPRLDFAYCHLPLIMKKDESNDDKIKKTQDNASNEVPLIEIEQNTTNTENLAARSESNEVQIIKNFLVLHGGMDTHGNIFDDCFIINLE